MQGVAARINEKFHQLHGVGGERFERTSGMVILPDGEIWFSGRPGVTRVSAAEMKRWRADPSYLVAFERFGVADGLRGAAEQTGGTLTALADDQGRLWFSTNRGVHWIDPKRIVRNPATRTLAPSLLALKVDERPLTLDAHVQLPVGSRDLRIDYTAPSLRMPERVRFRYRLDGLDTQWQKAGDRRQVLYSRLAPGTYRFRLIASDDAGRWSTQEAAFDLTVPAAFWQTRWFVIACLLLGAGLVWLLVRWRVAIARTRVHNLYRARVEERERIARHLHDTLLQSVQALVIRVETARARLARGEGDQAQAGLSRALEEAEAGLVEGRERIHDLRAAEAPLEDLESALRQLPEVLEFPAGIEYSVRPDGRPRRWRDPEREEVYWIAREAVSNAIRHAGASVIVVRVIYGILRSTLEVEDNGCGIGTGVAAHGGGEGHFGLIGMRERAALCGGRLSVDSLAKGGTRVRLHIPRWRFTRAS
jgi:signal transduction histidine kinase